MITSVTSAANATLKRLRSLREKKYRRTEGLFLAEGLRICTEALEAGWVPRVLVFAEGKGDHALVRRLVQATLGAGGQVIETTPDLLSGVTGKDNPQAVAAAYEPRALALDDVVPGPRTLVAERLRDPGNLGTILRTGDAVGAGGLILIDECVDPFSTEAVRASMGALFTVPVVRCGWDAFVAWLRPYVGRGRDRDGGESAGSAAPKTAAPPGGSAAQARLRRPSARLRPASSCTGTVRRSAARPARAALRPGCGPPTGRSRTRSG